MRLLREPLLHFLILGAALFALFGFVNDRDDAAPQEVVITASKVENLAAAFARTWQRPPTPQELNGLIQDYIREEILYREALELGLDRDDTIIRRRLRQKMEFIADDIAAQNEPTDDDLRAYLTEHTADYRVEDRFTFRHVYLNPERHRDDIDREVRQLLAQLQAAHSGANVESYGDPFLLPRAFHDVGENEIVGTLGEQFAGALRQQPVGQWSGPIASSYGIHLVLIDEQTAGRDPDLAEVRDIVQRDWERAQRLETNERFFQALVATYNVRVDTHGTGAKFNVPRGD